MTRLFPSIRTKLTLWYTALVAVTLLLFGTMAYWFTRSTLRENLDLSLRNEVTWLNEFIEPKAKRIKLKRSALRELQELRRSAPQEQPDSADQEQAAVDEIWYQIYQHTLLSPRKQLIQILDRNNDLLYHSPNLGKQRLHYEEIPYRSIKVVTTTSDDGKEIRLAVSQNDFVKIFVAYPLEDLNEVLGNLFSIFLILAPIALAISVVGGWFLAHTSLKPVDQLTRAVREITAQNLNQRLPAHNVNDEIGRLTATFNDMIGRLQASFAQIQQFSADASHELRTPLTIIRGEVEVALRNKQLSQPIRELLESVHAEVVRLSSIVEGLMSLVKSDAGPLVFQFSPVSLDRILKELVQDSLVLAETKEISVEVERLDPVVITGDQTRLRQLFLNILDNAVKYTPPKGRVSLALERQNGNAVVTIADTGIGIPSKEIPKIFDRFYRVPQKQNNETSGSGLGLSIARWVAEAHHGSIDVKSKLHKGSTFIITLPLQGESAEE
ncbi:MAG TPA: ATP-binding protein [Bacteroidota bacterium]|nr:ATP-binding protein [Bacteroidota bacterium]